MRGPVSAASATPAGVARRAKAPPIGELGGQHHRVVRIEAAEALQARDLRGEGRRYRERRDLAIQFIAPTESVFQQREVLAKHDPIVGRERGIIACEAALCKDTQIPAVVNRQIPAGAGIS